MALDTIATEQQRMAALNAARNRKSISQELRKGLFANNESPNTDQTQEPQAQSPYKARLALMKSGAIKEANRQGGAAIGATVGGTIGSALPIIGTGAGAFLGRFVGKKLGITGIVIMAILMIFALILFWIIALKGACEYFWKIEQWAVGAREVCKLLGS